MRCAALVVLAAAGCGRLGFGDSPDAPDAPAAPADGSLADLIPGCVLGMPMDSPDWLHDDCRGVEAMALSGAHPAIDPERGEVAELVGDPSCITVPDAPELRGGAAITVSAWFRPTVLTPASFGIVSKRTDFTIDSAYSLFVWASNMGSGPVNHLYVDVDGTDERYELMTDEFLNAWHHAAMVYDGSAPQAQRIAIYVDGVLRAYAPETSASIPTPSVPPSLAIGCLPLSGPAQSLVGRIDDVAMWDRALTASEIALFYAATR